MHLLFCAHLIDNFLFLRDVELRHFPPKIHRGVWFVKYVTQTVFISIYSNFDNTCSHIEDVLFLFCAHFIMFYYMFRIVYFGQYYFP